ncbi:MAG TPA: AMP-binding protein, partial [Patescibacteria group bacterium]|nr:AMP-binding protein [Patescibacteria group bacterium]
MKTAAAKIVEPGYPWEKSYPAGIMWDIAPQRAPVWQILEQAAQAYKNRTAIDFEGSRISYAELNALAAKIATGLHALGVTRGIKVGLFLPNTPHLIAFHYGTLRAGGTVVNYNPLYAERELRNQIEDSETDYLVTLDTPALLEKAKAVLASTRLKNLIVCPAGAAAAPHEYIAYDTLIANDGRFEPGAIDPDNDIAVLQYTGGTTGTPKGAMLTHTNLYTNTLQIARWHAPAARPGQEKIVCVLPLFHVFAMTVMMNMALHLGMEIIVLSKFDPATFIPLMLEKKPGFLPSVPAIYNAILMQPQSAATDFSFMKFCLSGGAPLPNEVKRGFEQRTGATVGEAYGQTETSPVVTCNPLIPASIKTGSVGVPIPGTIVEIISTEDGRTVLPPGAPGEVCVRGPQVMKGYYNKPEETAQVIRNGRLHTGDVGYLDEDGYLFLVDRLKDMVIVRGYKVYPRQIEEAIYLHPTVGECIVAGVPDAERGETVWAWIKTKDGAALTGDELNAFLADKLSPIEIPRKYIIRD